MSECVYRCTTDVEKWYEVIDSVFAYLKNKWKTNCKFGVGVASYGSVDEWIDVGGGSIFVLTLHVHECVHIIRDSMHITSKLCTCVYMFSVVTCDNSEGRVFCVLSIMVNAAGFQNHLKGH